MRDPRVPDTSRDEPMADLPSSHTTARPVTPEPEGINPQAPGSMPRGEDDAETGRNSPEFHDRPGAPGRPPL
jgi:hypothetical protein